MSKIKYCLSFPNRLTHFIHVNMEIQTLGNDEIELILPAWRPGRYELANFVSNLAAFEVIGADHKPLAFSKTTHNKWKVDTKGQEVIIVAYSYYANKMDAGSSVVNEEQVYINFINCLFYVEEFLNQSTEIQLELPCEFKTACALFEPKENVFIAENYYELVDSPLLASPNLKQFSYTVDDCEFFVSIQGESPLEEEQLKLGFEAFTKTQMAQMGDFPSNKYHFMLQSLPYRHYHGVEHKNSTVLVLGPNNEENKEQYYNELMGVASHELFHAWNVTRIRPKELLPYDFSKENYYETGFVTEGFTTYYGDLFLVRSGVLSQEEYFKEVNISFKRHFENYGRYHSSLTNSSYDLWVDGYKKLLPGRKVSIYVKGSIVALMADLFIRKKSNNKHSLDDVINDLWLNFGKIEKGYGKEDVYNILMKYGGSRMQEFINKYYEGCELVERELAELLDYVGCELTAISNPDRTASLFGFRLSENTITEIAPNSIAEKKLSIGDKLLKIIGEAISPETMEAMDGKFSFEVERNSQIKSNSLSTEKENYYQLYEIQANKSASRPALMNRKSWLNAT